MLLLAGGVFYFLVHSAPPFFLFYSPCSLFIDTRVQLQSGEAVLLVAV